MEWGYATTDPSKIDAYLLFLNYDGYETEVKPSTRDI